MVDHRDDDGAGRPAPKGAFPIPADHQPPPASPPAGQDEPRPEPKPLFGGGPGAFPLPADEPGRVPEPLIVPPQDDEPKPETVAAAQTFLKNVGKVFSRDKAKSEAGGPAAPGLATGPRSDPTDAVQSIAPIVATIAPVQSAAAADDEAKPQKPRAAAAADLFGKTSPTMGTEGAETKKMVIVAGKAHAVGLRWRVINDPANARLEAAEAAMTGSGEDLFVVTAAGTPQIGLGSVASGHVTGMPSLGGRLAAAINGNWSALFLFDDAYYVIGVRNGVIDDRGDVAFTSKADALRALTDVFSGASGRVLASVELVGDIVGIAGVEPFDPVAILTGALKPALQPIEQGREVPFKPIIWIGVLAAAAFVYLFNPFGLTDSIKKAAGFGPKVEKRVVVIPPAPWAGQPKAPVMMKRCTAAFALVPSNIRGWKVERVDCDGRALTVQVSRAGQVEQGAPPATWLDDWVKNSGTLVSTLIRLERPSLSRSQQGQVTIAWRMPPYQAQDRWREADSPEPMAQEQNRLWLDMERRAVLVNLANGRNTPYFGSSQVNVAFDLFQTDRVLEAMNRRVQVAARMTFDINTRRVTAGTRIFTRLQPFPTGEDVEIQRQPPLAQVEGPNLPPPPP